MFHSASGRHILWPVFVLMLCISAVICILPGCSKEQTTGQTCDLKLELFAPELKANTVSINGVVQAPVNRIQWDWGDGNVDKHLFFPAKHTYSNPGRYKITVTAFSASKCSEEKTIFVDVK